MKRSTRFDEVENALKPYNRHYRCDLIGLLIARRIVITDQEPERLQTANAAAKFLVGIQHVSFQSRL